MFQDAYTLDLKPLNAKANITSWKIIDTSDETERQKKEIHGDSTLVRCPIFEVPQQIRVNKKLNYD